MSLGLNAALSLNNQFNACAWMFTFYRPNSHELKNLLQGPWRFIQTREGVDSKGIPYVQGYLEVIIPCVTARRWLMFLKRMPPNGPLRMFRGSRVEALAILDQYSNKVLPFAFFYLFSI